MEPTKSIGIWIRVSTDFQVKDDSPEHHERRARMYAESKGWTVKEIYRLDAVSGKSVMEHPDAKRMLRDIRDGTITGLIFSKLARLARNTRELLEFSEIFRSCNADLISLSESIDTSSPAGRLFYTMIAAMAEWERQEIAERVAASVPIRAKMGKPLGGQAPYGYKWEDKELMIDPSEEPVRKLMYELFLEHKRKKHVARLLNQQGYRTRNGAAWSDTTITRLLRDPTAKGMRRANYTKSLGDGKRWVVKPESDWVFTECPAIVSADIWDECNRILDTQEVKRDKPARKAVHLFAGKLFCSCGGKMYVPSRVKKYVCTVCKKTSIGTEDIEEIYYENLKSFLLTKNDMETFLIRANEAIQSKEEQRRTLAREREKIKADMDDLVKLYLKKQIPEDRFGEYFNPLDIQYKQIENTVLETEAQLDFLKMQALNGDHILANAETLYEKWIHLEPEGKRNIVEELTESITIDTETISIKYSYNPSLSPNAPNEQRNFIPALPFWNSGQLLRNPLTTSDSLYIGDHIKAKRTALGLLQEDVARILNVTTDSITYWENHRAEPRIRVIPKIIEFLGYDPCPIEGDTFGDMIKRYRRSKGISCKAVGKTLGVDQTTVRAWESNKAIPSDEMRMKIERLMGAR